MRKLALLLLVATAATAQVAPSRFAEMRWRPIGPFRGGRTVAAAGVPSQPSVFYVGAVDGGIWKTNDFGRTWLPIFDNQPTGSIGAIAVAQSDPNVIYAGSGEGLQRPDLSVGDGMYKSTDAGKTWTHLGLRDAQQIPMIAVDPHDPNRLFVAVLGHPYGPNPERGIFRSTDGGKTFDKVLYRDENIGGMDVILDPHDANVVYAALWEARQGPWENAYFGGPGSGLFKSTDGGNTWKQLTSGLPTEALGRIGIDVSQSNPNILYLNVDAKKGGIYRSDDAGASWRLTSPKPEVWERGGDFNDVRISPKNPEVIYVANVVTWKSTDGGKTFQSYRGAPGGDDYHRTWINPNDPRIILIASDQGAIVTVNDGESWSSWYNQPTAQMFHVNADNAFPYRVCGGQQESGSACVETRGIDGRITMREWHPVGVEEYGYAVPDPLDADIVYGGKVSRYDRRTGQVTQVGPKPLRGANYRTVRTAPVVFSAADPHAMFFAANTVWKTTNGGESWSEVSPDLTRATWTIPPNAGKYAKDVKVTQRGVVYALAPSPLDINVLWAGTDDGLLHVTTDGGKSWTNVTPPTLQPWAKVSILEASHFDKREAYAAIDTMRLDDWRPHLLRTRDGGKTWTEIVNGIADGTTRVVREDPKTRGLLFAGTEQAVYVSFDDGDHWQSLRINMPATSIRDLVVHDDDVVAGTHGRGFWVLDDIEPLRQAMSTTALLRPARAWRVRNNMNTDTPLPPDEPGGPNPPDGAVIDYVLPADAHSLKIAILDGNGQTIRSYDSADNVEPPHDSGNIPWYWIRPQRVPATSAGMHRFVWDLHYTPLPGRPQYPIAATPYDTPPAPTSPWVMPGTYTVQLTVDGQTSTQPLTVAIDPRVKSSHDDLAKQFALSKELYDDLVRLNAAIVDVRARRDASKSPTGAAQSAKSGESALDTLLGEQPDEDSGPPRIVRGQPPTLNAVAATMRGLMSMLQEADVAPTTQAVQAIEETRGRFEDVMKRYEALPK